MRSRTSRRKVSLPVVAAAALLTLSGCGGAGIGNAGAAAVADGVRIAHSDVDALAEGLCAAQVASAEAQGQGGAEYPAASGRVSALQILLDTELGNQLANSEGVDAQGQLLAQTLADNERAVEVVPEEQRADFLEAYNEFSISRLRVVEVGRESLEESGAAEVPDAEALAEGERLLAEYVAGLDVEVDPRYGEFRQGAVVPSDSSLSVAQSGDARAAGRADAPAEYVAGLPATQKCS